MSAVEVVDKGVWLVACGTKTPQEARKLALRILAAAIKAEEGES